MRKDVKEVLELCRGLGLEPAMESGSGHYKVRDPKTGTYLFGISSTPSDPNWRWMIMRHLRRLGLLQRDATGKKRRGKRKPAIDLLALKRAQDQAASAGHRIPTLDDLEDSTEFFAKIKTSTGECYSEEAMEEAVDIMAARADASRISYIRGRLQKLLDEKGDELEAKARERYPKLPHGKGARAEFVRIAIHEVGPQRGIRAWKSEASGQQTLSRFLEDEKTTMQIWAADLTDATIDHINGLKWGVIDESRKKAVTPPPETQFAAPVADIHEMPIDVEPELDLEREPDDAFGRPADKWVLKSATLTPLEVTVEDGIRDHYATALLEILKAEGSKVDEKVLSRLDKLAGIA